MERREPGASQPVGEAGVFSTLNERHAMDKQQAESRPPMTPEEFARRMRKLNTGDIEGDHIDADNLMAETLRSLGYGDGVDIYESMSKWYA